MTHHHWSDRPGATKSLTTYITDKYPPTEHAKQIGFVGIITLATQSAAPAAAEIWVPATSFRALFGLTAALAAGSAAGVLLLKIRVVKVW